MIEGIIISSVVINFIFVLIFVFFFRDLKRGIMTMINRKKGFGLVGIVGADSVTKYYWRSFRENQAKIGNKIYCIHPKYIVRSLGVPTIYFHYGNSEPVDMLKRKYVKSISPEIITTMISRAKSGADALSNKGLKMDMETYLKFGTAGASILTMAMVYHLMTAMGV